MRQVSLSTGCLIAWGDSLADKWCLIHLYLTSCEHSTCSVDRHCSYVDETSDLSETVHAAYKSGSRPSTIEIWTLLCLM
jgi:hypothetical protein